MKPEQTTTIQSLPSELKFIIITYLTSEDLLSCV